MRKISTFIISRFVIKRIGLLLFISFFIISGGAFALANVTSNFQQTISPGTLEVDITDDTYTPIGSPSVAMDSATFSFTCQTTTGTLGTSSEQIYIVNPNAANDGFTVSIAASNPTDLWDSAGTPFDFNDPTNSGCDNGSDADSYGGQMTIDPSGATLATGACAGCGSTGLTLGSSASFNEGTLDSITLLTASAGSDDIGDWYIRGVSISQTIPAEQPAENDYNIDMVISVVAF